MSDIGTLIKEGGWAVAVVSGLVWFVLYLMKEHKKERQEWLKTLEKHSDEMNRNARAITSVLAGLKTLLENRK